LKTREYREKVSKIATINKKKDKKLRAEEVSGKRKMCNTK
jgi:hypothetical protein